MLKHLHIRNYALISELNIDFEDGFDVLTGETGTGKSIILGALSLLMGNRADSRNITEGEQKCVVEGEFALGELDLRSFFSANDLDYSPICVLRRELVSSGKSRSFINDTPVPLSLLHDLSNNLIDIHSQHQNLLLRDDKFQIYVVDVIARNRQEKEAYRELLGEYKGLESRLRALQVKAEQDMRDADYVRFQYEQLRDARLVANEEQVLEQEQRRLEHTKEVKTGLNEALCQLSTEDVGVLSRLQAVLNECKHIVPYIEDGESLKERIQTSYIELSDIADEFARLSEDTDLDPNEQARVGERLDLLNSLMQKHRVPDVKSLIALREEFASRIGAMESYEEEIDSLRKALRSCEEKLKEAADRLTQSRRKVLATIEESVVGELVTLGIKHAQMQVLMTERESYDMDGRDDIQFMFAANKNQQPQPIASVASGGEISRIMLCIKELIANEANLPTLVFDEIDTGISGEVAANMGSIIRRMSKQRQVLVITHLPQIASMGDAHYKVYKTDTEQHTETSIRRLSAEERVREIAQMLSANQVTDAAIRQAKELLNMPD